MTLPRGPSPRTPGRTPRAGVPRARARGPGTRDSPGTPGSRVPRTGLPETPGGPHFGELPKIAPNPPKVGVFPKSPKTADFTFDSFVKIGLGADSRYTEGNRGFVGNPLSWPENRQNGGPGRPGPGTLENPKKCTFCWVFNNSPSRDKIRTRFFGFCAQKFVTP